MALFEIFSGCLWCLERFGRLMIHNLDYEISLGCTLDGVTDCRVSDSFDFNFELCTGST